MRETQILRGLHKARATMGHNYADGYAPGAMDLRRGAVNIKGPGTTTSDSIHNVSLSKGESVLPAKTTAALGADNIARLIEQTNGKPPARGLRSGYADGKVPPMSDMADDLLGKKKPPGAAGSAAFGGMADDLGGRGTGAAGEPPKRDFNNAQQNAERWAQQQRDAKAKAEAARTVPPTGSTTTAGAGPVQEPAGPQTLKQRATNMFSAGKATVSGVASSAAAPLKTASAGAKGLGAGALGGYVGNSAAEAARTIGKPAGDAGAYVDDPRTAAIPTEGYSPAPQKQQYNYFTDNETGRNVGNTLNAAAMIPGVGPVARSALGLGAGAISRTARAAGNPLVAGALQGASANVRDGRDQTAQSAASTVEPFNPNQTAATQGRTNFTPGNAGAGRGNLTPPGTVLDSGATAPSDPRSRDFSAELNALPAQLPSDLRQGVIHKTVDARGRTTYSGMNVGAGADGQTQMVDGLGKTLTPRGGLHYAAAGAPVAMGAGGFAITPSGGAAQSAQGQPQAAQPSDMSAGQTGALGSPAVSQALQAAAARGDMEAVRSFYHNRGETWQGQTKDQYTDERLTNAIANERDPKKLAGLQGAMKARTDKADADAAQRAAQATGLREHQRMLLDERKQNLDELRYNSERKDKLDAAGTAGVKDGRGALVEAIKRDPNAYVPNDKGGSDFSGQRAGEIEKYISTVNPEIEYKGQKMSLAELYAKDPAAGDEVRQRSSNEYSMREFANTYSKGGLFGKGTDGGKLKVKSPPRDMARLQDAIHNNTHLTDAVWGGQVIEFAGQGGKTVAIPVSEILAQPNGREMLDAALARYQDDRN